MGIFQGFIIINVHIRIKQLKIRLLYVICIYRTPVSPHTAIMTAQNRGPISIFKLLSLICEVLTAIIIFMKVTLQKITYLNLFTLGHAILSIWAE